jgi:hypothetical protein
MDSEFVTLISNVGFPIAAFCAMFYMCNTTIKENTKVVADCAELIRHIIGHEKGDE